MMIGEGASVFAHEQGAKSADLDYLMTEKSRKRLEALPQFTPSVKAEFVDRWEMLDSSRLNCNLWLQNSAFLHVLPGFRSVSHLFY